MNYCPTPFPHSHLDTHETHPGRQPASPSPLDTEDLARRLLPERQRRAEMDRYAYALLTDELREEVER